ncbi:MAG: hypothetical protein M1840_008905 [Geoglossum simile]|nr:MAG: hypothetical protein M1840_008905 [Geoglossum simile]
MAFIEDIPKIGGEEQVSPTSPLCSICQRTLADVEVLPTKDIAFGERFPVGSFPVGPLAQIQHRSSHCPLCRLIYAAICDAPRPTESGIPEGVIKLEYYHGQDGFDATGMRLGTVVSFVNSTGATTNRRRRGRAVTGGEVDIGLIRKWLGACEEHHLEECMPKSRAVIESDGLPGVPMAQNSFRLIDVHSQCIVDAPESCKYLTLSYVWGLVPIVCLRKANKSQLMTPSGLASISTDIPQTIKDAMELVLLLGEQYLWVDSLCLIQDDKDDMREGIQMMDLVYECSYLTIIAASGVSANAGLPGVRRGSRIVTQIIEELKPDIKMVILRELDDYLSKSRYSSRGWTFQEFLLSRRSVIFINDQIYFRCRRCTWGEERCDDDFPLTSNQSVGSMLHYISDPDLSAESAYQLILLYYSARQLTKDSDAINGISALLKPLTIRMKARLLEGLPTSSFDMSVLFFRRLDSLRRRSEFPSYSWAGWAGQIMWDMQSYTWPEDEDIPPYGPKIPRMGIRDWLNQKTWIIWYATNGPGMPSLLWNPDARDGFSEGDICYRDRNHKHPSGRQTVPTIDISARHHPMYPILQFWTTAIYLYLSTKNRPDGDSIDVEILNHEGNPCGSVALDNASLLTGTTQPLEFLVLSESRYRMESSSISGLGNSDPGLEDPMACDLYWVMLVEWSNGLCERRGLGQVYQSAVESSCPPGPVWKEVALG